MNSNGLSYKEYVNIMCNRVSQGEKLRKQKFKEANRLAIKLVRFIYSNYAVKSIYIFGSLLDMDTFRIDSDIDIAVLGLDSNPLGDLREELSALGSPYKIDIIRLEDYDEFFNRSVLEEGKLIDR